jgi:hypothetical protein
MTGPRAHAYARVIQGLDDCAAAKLLRPEQDRIREAADALLFCIDMTTDAEATMAVVDLLDLYDHLVATGRWTPERADALAQDLWACGPVPETAGFELAA